MSKQNYPFDVSGHEKYYEYIKPYMTVTENNTFDFLNRWGGLMEENMKKGLPLTAQMIRHTCNQVAKETFVPNVSEGMSCLHTLATVWKDGHKISEQFPELVDPKICRLVRTMTNDNAFAFFDNYPDANQLDTSTSEGQELENSRVLATVFPTSDLIDLFYECASISKKTRDSLLSYMPEVKLPPSEVPDGIRLGYNPELAGVIKETWREDLKAVCDGAKMYLSTKMPVVVKTESYEK